MYLRLEVEKGGTVLESVKVLNLGKKLKPPENREEGMRYA